jgi:hypothetical protein
MRIIVHNLGPVNEAEIVIRPLTIFVGPNNSGKTWTAYLFAGIMGPYGWYNFFKYCSTSNSIYPVLTEAITEIVEKGNAKINILDFIAHRHESLPHTWRDEKLAFYLLIYTTG